MIILNVVLANDFASVLTFFYTFVGISAYPTPSPNCVGDCISVVPPKWLTYNVSDIRWEHARYIRTKNSVFWEKISINSLFRLYEKQGVLMVEFQSIQLTDLFTQMTKLRLRSNHPNHHYRYRTVTWARSTESSVADRP